MRKNYFFYSSFQNFFGVWAKDFQTFGQKTSRNCQNYLPRVRMNKFWLGIFFKMFWTVLDFLQKPLAWFSKFYLRVQSKNCGRNGFFILLFRFFSNFEQNFFRFLAKKLQDVDKTTLCVFRRTIFGLKFFSKVLSRFGFSSENLAWFSNFYLHVQRKNSGRNNFFYSSLQIFFGVWAKLCFRFLAKKLQEVVKTNFCVCRRIIFNLKFFSKFLNRFGYSAETFGMVLKLLSSCPQ